MTIEEAIENGPEHFDSQGIKPDSDREMNREPTHPGVFLRRFIEDEELTQGKLAEILDVSRQTISKVCNEQWGVSTKLAYKLSLVFEPEASFWIGLSKDRELFEIEQTMQEKAEDVIKRYQKHKRSAA